MDFETVWETERGGCGSKEREKTVVDDNLSLGGQSRGVMDR